MVAGATISAEVMQRCAESPAIPITTTQGSAAASGSVSTRSWSAVTSPSTACITVIQNRIAKVVSVRESRLVESVVPAKNRAEASAAIWPTPTGDRPGCVIARIPAKPKATATSRRVVSASPRTSGAISATQIGVVNSSANTCASGITVSA